MSEMIVGMRDLKGLSLLERDPGSRTDHGLIVNAWHGREPGLLAGGTELTDAPVLKKRMVGKLLFPEYSFLFPVMRRIPGCS